MASARSDSRSVAGTKLEPVSKQHTSPRGACSPPQAPSPPGNLATRQPLFPQRPELCLVCSRCSVNRCEVDLLGRYIEQLSCAAHAQAEGCRAGGGHRGAGRGTVGGTGGLRWCLS